MVGVKKVPEGIWRPADCYIINQFDEMTRILHDDRPTLIDSASGLLLWPVELVGALQNPMKLHAFPFDADVIEMHLHQNERSSRDEYVLRPYEDPDEEKAAVRFFFGVFDDLTEFDVVGHSRECFESIGGNQVEYSQCKVALHVVRRWQYYAWKVAMPVLLCTVFSFSALFFPIDDERELKDVGSTTPGIFSPQMDADALSERNNVAATMLLASSALLYVVASTLPKTSYLTTMDKFVLMNLSMQFAVAVVSWVTCGVFFPVTTKDANNVNLAFFCTLLFLLVLGSYLILGRPILRSIYAKPREWPATLSHDEPSTRYFPFETYVNVFPPWDPGSVNPIKLPPKTYGPAAGGGGGGGVPAKEGDADGAQIEPWRMGSSGIRKSRLSSGGRTPSASGVPPPAVAGSLLHSAPV